MSSPEVPPQPGWRSGSHRDLHRVEAPILETAALPGDHQRLLLQAPQVAAAAQPGQFLHIWPHPPAEIDRPPTAALLRRPYSISRLRPPDRLEILLRVRGAGGRLLAAKADGDLLDVIGPLGRGFSLRPDLRAAVVIAGGIGLAPVPFLLEAILARGARAILLVGAATDDAIPYPVERPRAGRATLPDLAALGAEVTFVSESVEGIVISEVLETRLDEFTGLDADLFAVGPRAMLKRLAEITHSGLSLQVSLEERMACGLGACRSCVVPARGDDGNAFVTVCRDGPVFYASEIDWERLEP